MMRRRYLRAWLLTALLGVASGGALAYERYVFVNGLRMNQVELAFLDAAQGEYIPNGRYWLNVYTGQWGYEGGPAEGYLGGGGGGGGGADSCAGQPFGHDCRMARGCEQSPEICSPIP